VRSAWRSLFAALIAVLSMSNAMANDIEYTYDDLGRLIEAADRTAGQAVQYTYDAAGNITSQTAVALSSLTIAGFTPQHGPPGAQVTVSGTGFSTTPSANAVSFNGTGATVVSATATQLVVTVPAGATTGPIGVLVGTATATSSGVFTVTTSADGPTITGLIPPVGTAGQLVTITGTNFDPVPANDAARFNTAFALVTQTASGSLLTSVPTLASSGKVVLTTPRGVAISPMDFIVVPASYTAASIGTTGRLPTDGSSTSVSLPTASHISVQLFDGKAGDLLAVGVSGMTVTSAAIKVFKPDGTSLTTGTFTAAGQGLQLPKLPVSGTYTLVVDAGTQTGNVVLQIAPPFVGTLVPNGTPTAVSLSPPGQRALLTFTGSQGTYANVSLTGVTLTAGTVSLIGPNGAVVDTTNVTTTGVAIQPQLPMDGQYTVLINPTGNLGGALNVALTTPSSPTLTVNTPLNLTLSNTNPVSLNFPASAAAYMGAAISESGGNFASGATLTVYNPDGSTLTTGPFSPTCNANGCTGTKVLNLGPMPSTGTYTLGITRTGTGSGTVTVTVSAAVVVNLTIGTSQSAGTTLVGQPLELLVPGNADQFLSVDFSGPTLNGATLTLLNPDGTVLQTAAASSPGCTQSGCETVANYGPLLMSGTQTVLLQPGGTFTVTASNPVVQPISLGGSANVQAAVQGQAMQLNFTGTAGQYLTFSASETTDLIPGATLTLVAPDGSVVAAGALVTNFCNNLTCGSYGYTGTGYFTAGPLPLSGSYTILVQQTSGAYPNHGTGTLALTLLGSVNDSLTAGFAGNENLGSAQPMVLSFAGTSGQYASIALVPTGGQAISGTVTIFNPDGSVLKTGPYSGSCPAGCSGGAVFNLGPLAATGTYTLVLQQSAFTSGSISATLSNPVTEALSGGATVSQPGQSMQETFSGSAGQYFSLGFYSTTGGIPGGTITILNPDGSKLTSQTFTANCNGSSCLNNGVVNFGPLPATGSYSALVQQSGTVGLGSTFTGGLALSLTNPANGGSMSPGTALPVTSSARGQALSAIFNGTAGSAVTLHVAESQDGINGAAITILNPDGTPLQTGTFSATGCLGPLGCNGFSGALDLYPTALPQTGTYTVLAQQVYSGNNTAYPLSGTLSFTATGISAGSGSSNNYSTTTAGQSINFSFSGTTGQSMTLVVSNLVITPSSGYVSFSVYRPDGTLWYSINCNAGAIGCAQGMYRIPQTGTYAVVAAVHNGAQTMSFTAGTVPWTMGQLTPNTPQTVSTTTPGQGVALTFTTTPGQTVAVALSGLTTVPSGNGVYFEVYNSAMTRIATTTTASGTMFNLTNLPADTYSLLVYPGAAVTFSGQVGLYTGTVGSIPANGTSANFSTHTAGQAAYLNFAGTAGQSLSVVFSNLAITPSGYVSFSVYRPDGTLWYSINCNAGALGYAKGMYPLPQTGTYTVLAQVQNGAQTMSFTASMVSWVVGSLALNTPQTLTLSVPGQGGRLSFTATAGQTVALALSGLTTSPTGGQQNFIVVNSAGTAITSNIVVNAGSSAMFNLQNLAADTYWVLVYPGAAYTSSAQVALYTGAAGSIPSNGGSANFSTQTSGQAAYLSFPGMAGQALSLVFTNLAVTPSGYVSFTVYRPDTTVWYTINCNPGALGCAQGMDPLPQTGTYTVLAQVQNGAQTMSFTASMVPWAMGALALNTPQTLTLGTPGQGGALTFTTTAGQTVVAVALSGLTTSPAGGQQNFIVYNSAGTAITSNIVVNAGSSAMFNLTNLVADTYSVLIYPGAAYMASAQVEVYSGTTGTIPLSGTSASYSTQVPGQGAYTTFSGTAGQSVSIAISNVVFSPSSPNYMVAYIYKPDGSTWFTANCYAGATGCNIAMSPLPQTGTYKVNFGPAGSQTMSFTITGSQWVTGTLALNTPQTVTMSTPGQGAALTFTTTAGQTVALALTGLTTVPAGNGVYFTLVNSAGATVATTTTSSTALFNLPNMAADTYKLMIYPGAAVSSTAQVELFSGTTGTIPLDNSAANYSTQTPGQGAYTTFSGTTGQSVSIAISNVVLSPSSPNYMVAYIYKPDGSTWFTVNCSVGPTGCNIAMSPLPQTGTYKVNFGPAGSQTMSFTITASQWVTGTLALNTPQTVTMSTPGQGAALTFATTAGQTVALALTGLTTVPAGNGVYFTLVNSAGATVASTTSTSTTMFNLPNLAADTYKLMIYPGAAVSSTAQVELFSGTTGTIPLDNSSASYSTQTPGQGAYTTFSGTAGQSVSIAISNLVLSPSSPTYMVAYIYKPDGSTWFTANCSVGPTGCNLAMSPLPQTGTYKVNFGPVGAQTMSFTITASQWVTGTLAPSTPQTVSMSTLGQGALLTFTTTATQTVTVHLSGLATVPSGNGVYFTVTNSAGTTLATTTTSSAANLTLTNLAAGTYKVLIYPGAAVTSSMQVSYP
jgi:YD repeat-containing protein